MVITAMVYADSGEEETLDSEFSSKKGVIIINGLLPNHMDLPSPV